METLTIMLDEGEAHSTKIILLRKIGFQFSGSNREGQVLKSFILHSLRKEDMLTDMSSPSHIQKAYKPEKKKAKDKI
jgi:hypothetical protein